MSTDTTTPDDWRLDEIMARLVARVSQDNDRDGARQELRDFLAESEELTAAAKTRLDIYEAGTNSRFAGIARDLLKFALAPAEAACPT